MKPVREIIPREIIDDLWGAGYTILPRARHPDPFFVPPEMIPQGRAYQWMHLVHDKFYFEGRSDRSVSLGWAPVPASRHDGYFMPAGHVGDIEVNGLGLFEKPKFEVDADRDASIAKAQKQVDDWKAKWGGEFCGEVTVGTQTKLGEMDTVTTTAIGATKTVEDVTAIPREMVPYIAQIFEERDRLGKQYAEEANNPEWSSEMLAEMARKLSKELRRNKDAPKWPTLNAIILPYAIANIRKRINEEATIGQASEH